MVPEYASLRQELLQLAASISRWQLVGFVAAGVAFAAGMASFYGIAIVAAALIVVAGCVFGIIHDLRSILRIAAYIQAVHEGRDTGAMWETRQEMIAGADIKNPLKPGMTPILSLLWVGLITALAPYISMGLSAPTLSIMWHPVYWLQFFGWQSLVALIVPIVWLAFWAYVRRSYKPIYSGEFKQKTMHAFFDSMRRP
jgi:hypothetical protein